MIQLTFTVVLIATQIVTVVKMDLNCKINLLTNQSEYSDGDKSKISQRRR